MLGFIWVLEVEMRVFLMKVTGKREGKYILLREQSIQGA